MRTQEETEALLRQKITLLPNTEEEAKELADIASELLPIMTKAQEELFDDCVELLWESGFKITARHLGEF